MCKKVDTKQEMKLAIILSIIELESYFSHARPCKKKYLEKSNYISLLCPNMVKFNQKKVFGVKFMLNITFLFFSFFFPFLVKVH